MLFCMTACVCAYDLWLLFKHPYLMLQFKHIFTVPTHKPRFYFSAQRTLAYQEEYMNMTRLLLQSNGLKVTNLHVYDYMDSTEPDYANIAAREFVMGQWQKNALDLHTHIHVHDRISSDQLRLGVLAHEIAHEYFYKCHGVLQYQKLEFEYRFKNTQEQASLQERIEKYTDRLAQFLLAKTCVFEPSAIRLGMYPLNSTHNGMEKTELLRSEEKAYVYRDLHCQQGVPRNTFDTSLCAHEGHPSIWVGSL